MRFPSSPSTPRPIFPIFSREISTRNLGRAAVPANNEEECVRARACVCARIRERERERGRLLLFLRATGAERRILRASVKQLNITAIVNSLLSFVRNRYVRDLHQI